MRIVSRVKYFAGLLLITTCLLSSHADNGLLYYINSKGKPVKVSDQAAWEKRYLQILDSMQIVMGPLPERSVKIIPKQQYQEDTIINGVTYHKLFHTANKTTITRENSVCIGGIREDGQKRIFVNSFMLQYTPEIKEVMLYDFSSTLVGSNSSN